MSSSYIELKNNNDTIWLEISPSLYQFYVSKSRILIISTYIPFYIWMAPILWSWFVYFPLLDEVSLFWSGSRMPCWLEWTLDAIDVDHDLIIVSWKILKIFDWKNFKIVGRIIYSALPSITYFADVGTQKPYKNYSGKILCL